MNFLDEYPAAESGNKFIFWMQHKVTFHSEYIVLDTRGCREYSNDIFRLFKRADFFFQIVARRHEWMYWKHPVTQNFKREK